MKYKHIHFIGIGGIGMGALAFLVLERGIKVSGSDVRENDMVLKLRDRGARIIIGHQEKNLEGADCVVYSSAIKQDNAELVKARKQGLSIIQRADLLSRLMENYTGITIAGAHGKTTTTSLIAHMLACCGYNPTSAVGGIIHGLDTNARFGSGKYFVTEVDESDGSFLFFRPNISVITNIDFEHVDFYHNWDNVNKAYEDYVQNTRENGILFICGDDQRLLNLLTKSGKKFQSYGFKEYNDVVVKDVVQDGLESEFKCLFRGKEISGIKLIIPGQHNILNALAAMSVGLYLGIDTKKIIESLKTFKGVKRRFDIKGQAGSVLVVDDYAHHPNEIKATLSAARQMSFKRMVVIVQPHRYTRLKFLMDGFIDCLKDVSNLIITDVYAAGEQEIEGASSILLMEAINKVSDNQARYVSRSSLSSHLKEFVQPGDIVLFLGAGDITQISEELADYFKNKKESLIKQNV